MAKVFEIRDRTYKFRTNGPELVSPEFSIIPSTTSKISQYGPEHSDKSTSQSKQRG